MAWDQVVSGSRSLWHYMAMRCVCVLLVLMLPTKTAETLVAAALLALAFNSVLSCIATVKVS